MVSPNPEGSDAEAFLDPVEELLAGALGADTDWHRAETELCALHPLHAEAITRRFALLRHRGLLSEPVPAGAPAMPERLGDFRMVRRLGSGGMGVVYLAEQESLGRRVALKILPHQATLDPRFLERFRREAHAAARLQHAHIVPVYGIGESDGLHWYAMQYIDGKGLDSVLADVRHWWSQTPRAHGVPLVPSPLRGLLPEAPPTDAPEPDSSSAALRAITNSPAKAQYHRSVARIGLQVAEALAYAHEQGILHRDIKPSNLLLDAQGEVWVTDFGLCKAEGTADLTHTGDLVGTLRYLAPERLSGGGDVRSEVYALGATLYELLTLRPAFDHPSRAGLMQRIAEQEPVPPRRIEPAIPRDLEVIVRKAMQKEAALRYATVTGMAQDLRAFLDGRPIAGRPPSAGYYLRLALRRNRALAAMIVATLILLTAATMLYVVHLDRARVAAEQARDAARWDSYLSSIAAAASAFQVDDLATASNRLAESPAEHRGWEWRHLTARLHQELRVMALATTQQARLCYDGESLFAAGDDGVLRGFDPHTGQALRELRGHRGLLGGIAMSPDCRSIATAGVLDHRAGVWDVDTGKVRWLPHPHEVQGVAFAPGGDLLATACGDGVVRLWRTGDGSLLTGLRGHTAGVTGVSFHHGGRWLLSASDDATARVWDVTTGECTQVLAGHDQRVLAVACQPQGDLVATASEDGSVALWNCRDGQRVRQLHGHRDRVCTVAWSPSGELLATAGADHTIRLWDVAKGAARTVLQGHDDLVFQIAFARDGQTVASASRDRTLRIWDVEAAQPVQTFRAHLNQIEALAVSQDGAQIATGGRDGLVRVWDAATGLERATMVGHANHVNALAFDAAASRLASAGGKSPLRIWDLSSGGCARVIDAIQRASDLAFTADGRSLLAASSGGALLIDVGSGTVRVPLPTPGEEQCCVALHPDGQTVATGSITGEIRLWDLRSGSELRRCSGHPLHCKHVEFVEGGTRLLSAANDGTLRLWDVASGIEITRLEVNGQRSLDLTCSSDGRRIVTGCVTGSIKVWSYPDLRLVTDLHDVRRWVQNVRFTAQGALVSAGLRDVTVWDSRTTAERTALRRTALAARAAARPIVDRLLAEHSDPVEAVSAVADLALDPAVADQARCLLRTREGTLDRLHQRAWAIVADAHASAEQAQWACCFAVAAVDSDPAERRFQTLLAGAQHRLGRDREALQVLDRGRIQQPGGEPEPIDDRLLRVLALAGSKQGSAAAAELAGLSSQVRDNAGTETRGLLAEARAAVQSAVEPGGGGHK